VGRRAIKGTQWGAPTQLKRTGDAREQMEEPAEDVKGGKVGSFTKNLQRGWGRAKTIEEMKKPHRTWTGSEFPTQKRRKKKKKRV